MYSDSILYYIILYHTMHLFMNLSIYTLLELLTYPSDWHCLRGTTDISDSDRNARSFSVTHLSNAHSAVLAQNRKCTIWGAFLRGASLPGDFTLSQTGDAVLSQCGGRERCQGHSKVSTVWQKKCKWSWDNISKWAEAVNSASSDAHLGHKCGSWPWRPGWETLA